MNEELDRRPTLAGEPLLSAIGLKKYYPIKQGALQRVVGHVGAVDDVSFDVIKGETLGIVGESGCGKTTLGRCLSALLKPTHGGAYFETPHEHRERLTELINADAPLTRVERAELDRLEQRYRVDLLKGARQRDFRRNCQIVFQDAFASLNPRHLVRDIVGRPLSIHGEARGHELTERVVELLEAVGLGRQHLNRYPHEFSGGQQQRISIARALALNPALVVLDEPTSALDVSVQAQILNLLHELQEAFGLTYVFVSHDLGVIQHISDRIVVMYLGEVVEAGNTAEVFDNPKHPYTRALIDASPSLTDPEVRASKSLVGAVPDPAHPPQGCRFHTRCPVATSACGWDFKDVSDWLSRQPDLIDGLVGSAGNGPFEGEVEFRDAVAAELAVKLLDTDAPGPMREVLITSTHGASVTVHLPEMPRPPLSEVLPHRHTNCILATAEQA